MSHSTQIATHAPTYFPAGLVTAQRLAKHFDEVVCIERDQDPGLVGAPVDAAVLLLFMNFHGITHKQPPR